MDPQKKAKLNKILEKESSKKQDNLSFLENEDKKRTEEKEAQLLVDIFEKNGNIIIKSIIAGVKAEDLDISFFNDIITIRGERINKDNVDEKDYFYKECYWGKFSRSIVLPYNVESDKLKAVLENGILTITIPKTKMVSQIKVKVNK